MVSNKRSLCTVFALSVASIAIAATACGSETASVSTEGPSTTVAADWVEVNSSYEFVPQSLEQYVDESALIVLARPVGDESLLQKTGPPNPDDPLMPMNLIYGQRFVVEQVLLGDSKLVAGEMLVARAASEFGTIASVRSSNEAVPYTEPLYILSLSDPWDSPVGPAWFVDGGPYGAIPFAGALDAPTTDLSGLVVRATKEVQGTVAQQLEGTPAEVVLARVNELSAG